MESILPWNQFCHVLELCNAIMISVTKSDFPVGHEEHADSQRSSQSQYMAKLIPRQNWFHFFFKKHRFSIQLLLWRYVLLQLLQLNHIQNQNFKFSKMKERGLRPWRKITRNFSVRAANTVEKLWLVKEMVLHGETAKDLSNLYGIGRKALNRWTKAYNERGILHGK